MDVLSWLLQVPPEPISTPPALPPVEPSVTELIQQAAVFAGALAGVITGLVEIAKKMGLPSRFAPAMAVAFGLGLSLTWELATPTHPPLDWWLAVVEGITSGLVSGGLYSFARSVLNPKAFEPDEPRRQGDPNHVDYSEVRKKS